MMMFHVRNPSDHKRLLFYHQRNTFLWMNSWNTKENHVSLHTMFEIRDGKKEMRSKLKDWSGTTGCREWGRFLWHRIIPNKGEVHQGRRDGISRTESGHFSIWCFMISLLVRKPWRQGNLGFSRSSSFIFPISPAKKKNRWNGDVEWKWVSLLYKTSANGKMAGFDDDSRKKTVMEEGVGEKGLYGWFDLFG